MYCILRFLISVYALTVVPQLFIIDINRKRMVVIWPQVFHPVSVLMNLTTPYQTVIVYMKWSLNDPSILCNSCQCYINYLRGKKNE